MSVGVEAYAGAIVVRTRLLVGIEWHRAHTPEENAVLAVAQATPQVTRPLRPPTLPQPSLQRVLLWWRWKPRCGTHPPPRPPPMLQALWPRPRTPDITPSYCPANPRVPSCGRYLDQDTSLRLNLSRWCRSVGLAPPAHTYQGRTALGPAGLCTTILTRWRHTRSW